jgi:tRNA G10  N-methylase Trm11
MAPTQDALYDEIDLELSWSERELPEHERTRHVHRLHPYLGKFIPQLVEVLLERYVRPGGRVLDPFAGSGTTLVQALESDRDATGVDIAAFNALLMRVKTTRYNLAALERDVGEATARLDELDAGRVAGASPYLRRWYAPRALAELLAFRSIIGDYEHRDVLRVVLARAARSARRTTHFDLDFPRDPQRGPYWCHKHKRECTPVTRASHFVRRYALDTVARIERFSDVRVEGRSATVLHGDARALDLGGRFDGIVTSPPYPGLIDYHEQHRYAYELLGLDDLGTLELGKGATKPAIAEYVEGVARVLERASERLRADAPIVVVVNDRRGLYDEVLERAGLRLDHRLRRHVNRRTGRRAGEYFEDVLVARKLSHS